MKIMPLGATRVLLLSVGVLALVAGSARAADQLTDSHARDIVAPFYDALNTAPGNDVPDLVVKVTSPDWLSCSGNDTCRPRDKVIGAIVGLHDAIPDLKWEIKELRVAGNQVIVRGEATGTPGGEFLGVPYGGKSFKVMSIDVHTIEGDKLVRSYHVEDWMGATRQLSTK
jgi:predicted ester cyclase